MSATRLTLLARTRASAGAPTNLETWLASRPADEPWPRTWELVPNVEQLDYLAALAGCQRLWLEDARRRADVEAKKARLACKPDERPRTASAGASGYRAVIGPEMIESCLRVDRVAEA